MKNVLLGSIAAIISLSLVGCQQIAHPAGSLTGEETATTFIEPEPSDWVEYMKPIREYMYYRTQAVVSNNIDLLWNKYPELKENIDRGQGINVEKFEVEALNGGFGLLDANYSVESHNKIKVRGLNEHEAVVLVHGSIIYLRDDFDESGAEYLMEVFLENKNNSWTVVKTDEYTLSEYKDRIR